ncbi:pseudouridine synthase [Clostridium sp. CAG:921]|nr:pseudouridine synthase [Clostridium sp. CAG:921]
MRINKYIAACGVCSRRKAEEYILSGRVRINDMVVSILSADVKENDEVFLDEKKIELENKYVYLMLNKPRGYVTTNNEQFGRKCTLDLIKENVRVYPIGRLDMDTEGLLLFTNDGEFANMLTHPKNKIEKTYIVTTNTFVTNENVETLKKGVDIGGYVTKEAKVKKIGEKKIKIIISEGKNRQVRKMCSAVGLEVVNLKRVQISSLKLGNLACGKYRYLTKDEIRKFY